MKFRTVIAAGLVARVAAAPFLAHPFDMYSWFIYVNGVTKSGISLTQLATSLMPLWEGILILLSYPYQSLTSLTGISPIPVSILPSEMNPGFGVSVVPGPLFNVLLKAPLILSDTAIAFILRRLMLLQGNDVHTSNTVSAMFYLNPITAWISGAWGQFDSITTLFAALALYLTIKKRIFLASLATLASASTGIYSVVTILPLSIYLMRTQGQRAFALFVAPVFLLLSVFTVLSPPGVWSSLSGLLLSRGLYGIYGFGLTYWSVSLILPVSFDQASIVAVGLSVLLTLLSLIAISRMKFSDPLRDLSLSYVLLALAFFLSYPIVSEARFIWLAAFLPMLVSAGTVDKRTWIALSSITFLYAQKNFPFYLLPVASVSIALIKPLFQATQGLRSAQNGILLPNSISGFALAALGVGFSLIAASAYAKCIKLLLSRP